jgi:hypothetical protein
MQVSSIFYSSIGNWMGYEELSTTYAFRHVSANEARQDNIPKDDVAIAIWKGNRQRHGFLLSWWDTKLFENK